MSAGILLAFSTFPDAETAGKISAQLVSSKLAACANLLPPVQSIYEWQGKLEQNSETLVLFKIATDSYAEFEARLKSLHPYDVPEIIAAPVTHAFAPYADWVRDNCS